jgi:hypothetical protein
MGTIPLSVFASPLLDACGFVHKIERPLFHLFVDAPDILPDNAHGDELNTPNKQDGHDNRGPAWHKVIGKQLESDRV